MIEPRRELKYVKFQNGTGGGIVGKARLAPMSRTPRSEPKVVKTHNLSPRTNDPRSPREKAEALIWRPQRDELLTDDLKEKVFMSVCRELDLPSRLAWEAFVTD